MHLRGPRIIFIFLLNSRHIQCSASSFQKVRLWPSHVEMNMEQGPDWGWCESGLPERTVLHLLGLMTYCRLLGRFADLCRWGCEMTLPVDCSNSVGEVNVSGGTHTSPSLGVSAGRTVVGSKLPQACSARTWISRLVVQAPLRSPRTVRRDG